MAQSEVEVLQQRIRELEAELANKRAMVDMLFDNNPDGVVLADAQANTRTNAAAQAIMGSHVQELERDRWQSEFGFFRPDRKTPIPNEELGLLRAMAGERIDEEVLFVRTPGRPAGLFMSAAARPLPGGGALAVMRDVTEKIELSEQLQRRNAELSAREQDNRELIERLRVAVDELSTPVLEIWDDVLALPVIGIVDTQRSAQMTERVLAEVVRTRARHVIVDLTGVQVIDTSTADRFLRLARAIQLLGARCVITGVQPAVSQTLVELGVDFSTLETHRNLKNALHASIARSRIAETKAANVNGQEPAAPTANARRA